MSVPYTFATATNSIPLSQLDSNFATAITLGSTNIYLGNTTTTVTGLTLTGSTFTGNVTTSNAVITGGSIDGTTVGATTASTGAFTTLSASSTVSGTGFSTYLASPPAIGSTAANTGAFTTLSASSTTTLSGGTANGVAYLNGSKVLTTGSALVFDGTNLGIGSATLGSTLRLYAVQASGEGNPTLDGSEVGLFQRNFVATQSASIAVTSGSTSTASVYLGNKNSIGAGRLVYDSSASALAFYSSAAEQMRLTSTGLGIGTSSPSYKLDVNGSGNIIRAINSSTSSAFILSTNSGASSILVMGNESTTAGSSATGSASYAGLLFTTGSKPLQFGTNSTIQATLDTSGNLGLGVTPSAWSAYKAIQVNTGLTAYSSGTGGDSGLTHNAYYNGANWIYIGTGYATQYDMYLGAHRWYSAGSGSAGGTISFTQAMTLDNSGNLLVGATSAFNTSRATFTSQANNTIAAVQGTAGGYCFVSSALSNGGTYYHCSFTENGTQRGSITSNGSVTAYNITSDQRLKENIVDADTASNLIDALQVRQFDWKSDGSHQRYGFVAQELVAVAPEAVHQPADPEEMMAVDYSKLVPMLVKEIQSLRARLKAANIA